MHCSLNKLTLPVFINLALTFNAFAEIPTDKSGLVEAIEAGLNGNSRLKAEVHQLESDVHSANIEFGELLPTVDLRAATGYEKSSGDVNADRSYNSSSIGIEARQNLFNGFAGQARYLASHSNAMIQYFNVLDEAERLGADAARAYFDIARAQAINSLVQVNVDFHRDLVQKIEAKVDQGVSRRSELEQAKSRYTLALGEMAAEKANLFAAMADYQRVTGDVWPVNKPATFTVETNIDLRNLERLSYALNNHHLISAAKSEFIAASHDVTAANEGFAPRIDLRAKSDRYSNYLSTFEDRQISSVDLLASINLFRGGADEAAKKAAISRKYKAADLKIEACKNVRRNTQVTLYSVENLERRVEYFRIQADAMRKARAAYEQQFGIGRRDLIELLDAENEYFQARRNLIDVETDLSIAKVRLLAASGQLISTIGLTNALQVQAPVQRQLVLYKDQLKDQAYVDLNCPQELISLDEFHLPPPVMPAKLVLNSNNDSTALPITVAQNGELSGLSATLNPAVVSQTLQLATRSWAQAWETGDIKRYISFYSPFFQPEAGSYESWEMQRRERVGSAKKLAIKVSDIQVIPDFDDPREFQTNFIQEYKASHYQEVSRKVLTWKMDEKGKWLIVREQNLPADTVLDEQEGSDGTKLALSLDLAGK